ncbi:MAG: DinB family protein [Acidobacteria bacterium]|nr:DinB family protein [Acidobacteriota bacterium]
MNNQSIDEIYAANDKIRARTLETLSNLTDEQTRLLPEGEKWTIAEFVEHIAIVEDGMAKISAKLLAQAQSAGKAANGKVNFSENFAQKAAAMRDEKFEAPDRVRPSGEKTVAESLEKLQETRRQLENLRPLFEKFECSDFKFPHPFMGDLSATEWLALVGGHEARHLQQIENFLAKTPVK